MIEQGGVVERLYGLAKAGDWISVLASWVGEPELAAECCQYVRASSGWTFLHQAAYFGQEPVVRALVRLGASTTSQSHDGESPFDIADKRGHQVLARTLELAARSATGLWAAPAKVDLLPSSCAWSESAERRAPRNLRVAYGGGLVTIPRGARYFVDSFERTLVGWHGTYDPPSGMDGESMLGSAIHT